MSNEKESIGEELFIEELGEVRGGAILVPGKFLTLARGHLEVGISPRPHFASTKAMGEEGPSMPRARPAPP